MSALQHPVIRALTIVVLLASGLGLMFTVYRIRLEELGQNLESAADKTMALRSLGLIAKYRLIQSRMKSGETIALLRKEASTAYAGSDSVVKDGKKKLPVIYDIGLGIVNFVNVVAGGKPITNRRKSRQELLIEEAYLLELQRNFSDAVGIYDRLIAELKSEGNVRMSFARLHRGYCLSFGTERQRAVDDLRYVIAANAKGEYRLTAEVLLAYIEEFNRKTAEIQALPESTAKGNAYFNVGAYSNAIRTLENLPAKQKSSEVDYLLGRSYEEIGKSDKALTNYRRLIQTKDQKFAKLANRRVFAMGSIYSSGKSLVAESEAAAKTSIPDAELLQEKKKTEILASAISEKRENIASEIREEKIAAAGSVKTEPVPVAAALPEKNPAPPTPPAAPVGVPRMKPKLRAAPVKEPEPRPESALTRTERKSIIQREARIDEIVLADGNKLWGIILEENSESISMLTVMGKVAIDKKQIRSRAKVESAQTFQVRGGEEPQVQPR